MKKIVLSAIAALVLTVGVYHLALLMGAREGVAAFVTVGAVAVVAALTALAIVGFAAPAPSHNGA